MKTGELSYVEVVVLFSKSGEIYLVVGDEDVLHIITYVSANPDYLIDIESNNLIGMLDG